MEFHDTFRAMNTDVDVVGTSQLPLPALALSARLLFEQQEARFSRFRPDSLVSQLNSAGFVEDAWLAEVCRMSLDAHAFTGGLFNPMVLPALVEAGYSTSFEQVTGGAPRRQLVPDPNECLQVTGNSVRLLHGQVDLGGIVKGWTADLAVESLAGECEGVLINAGGDIRCSGTDGTGEGWEVTVDAPRTGQPLWHGRIDGALATSTSMKRRWPAARGGQAHHLIDPRSGLPAESPFVQVSAWGDRAWRAECWAKAVLIGGTAAAERATAAGVRIMTLDRAGRLDH